MTEEQILCGNNGGTVMLFDLNESRCAANWTAHRSAVQGLTFHGSNTKICLSCGYDGKLNVLSVQQRQPVQTYSAHPSPINHVSCSADQRYAATCGEDKTVRVFDLTAQRQWMKFEVHSDAVNCVEFHPVEPILMSCSVDRSIRFFDLQNRREIPVSFPLDSSPVDMVKFTRNENIAFSLSPDYLKVVGWRPPTFFDHFTLGLERVHDFSFVDQAITIASSTHDHVLIHRMRVDALKPFCEAPAAPTLEQHRPRPAEARVVDLPVMPVRKLSVAEKDGKNAVKRSGSTGSSVMSEEASIFYDFRKSRATYMTFMNEKFSRLTRVSDLLDQFGLTGMLKNVTESGDLGLEVLVILRMKPEIVKLDHAALLMQIACRVFDQEKDLAIATAESMMQGFGKLVCATRSVTSLATDSALEDRKRQSEIFVDAFKEMAPKLRTVAAGQSTISQTAAELLSEWKVFLR
jgi:hypothetical protein